MFRRLPPFPLLGCCSGKFQFTFSFSLYLFCNTTHTQSPYLVISMMNWWRDLMIFPSSLLAWRIGWGTDCHTNEGVCSGDPSMNDPALSWAWYHLWNWPFLRGLCVMSYCERTKFLFMFVMLLTCIKLTMYQCD